MNKWMVLTPGRSGSTFIVESISLTNSIRPFNDSLSMVHSLNDINFNIDTVDQLNFQPGNVWHSHNLNSLNFVDNNTELIISTRSIKEITVSFELAKLTKIWHFKNNNSELNQARKNDISKLTSFEISPASFVNQYNLMKNWYMACREILETKKLHYKVIDYSEFANNNEKIFDILKISKNNLTDIVTKIPYNIENIIKILHFLYGIVDLKNDSAYNLMTQKYE